MSHRRVKQKKPKGKVKGPRREEEIEETLDYMSTEELVEHIVSLGLNVTEELALDDVYSAFDEGWVDTFLIGTDDVEDMLNDEKPEYMMFMEREPLDHFSKENIGRLMEANPPEEEAA